jgi:RHS repeat-associated protein
MILIAFQAVVPTARADMEDGSSEIPNGGTSDGSKPPIPLPSESSADFGGNRGMDELGDPNGTVSQTFEEPLNSQGEYADYTLDPVMSFNGSEYSYATAFGTYIFSTDAPHAMSVLDLEGLPVAGSSAFVVVGDRQTIINGSRVLNTSNHTYESTCNVSADGVFQGTLTTTVQFDASQLPKITAVFMQDINSTLENWHISWRIPTPFYHLRTSFDTALDFGDFLTPVPVSAENATAEVGPSAIPQEWSSTTWATWNDTPNGTLSVGPTYLNGTGNGMGLTIDFPVGMASVDPYLFTRSPGSYSTQYSTQKKVFYFNNRYYAFYSEGGDPPSIRYVVGQEVSRAIGQMSWSAPITVIREEFAWSFDVDMRDGVVGLAWMDASAQSIYFKRGNIVQNLIDWSPTILVNDAGGEREAYPLSVAIDDYGFSWIAVARYDGNSLDPNIVETYRTTSPEGATFQSAGNLATALDHREALRLVPIGAGYVSLIASHYYDTEFAWSIYDPSYDEWLCAGYPGWCYTSGANLAYATPKIDKFSATSMSNGTITVAYIDASNNLKIISLRGNEYEQPSWIDGPDPDPPAYPAIQRGINDDLHLFWVKNCFLYYKRFDSNGGTGISPIFMTGIYPRQLSTSLITASHRAFIVFSAPADVKSVVYFASVPSRIGGGGSGETAWNRPGIGEGGASQSQYIEYLSPMSGLLFLKQTDISMPGRGLDLSIERLYRPPEAFDAFDTPWDYEEPAQLLFSMGEGWSLNLPFYTSSYLYLWDGQRYVVNWNGNVYDNKDGEYFHMERFVTSSGKYVRLTTKSGTLYQFEYAASSSAIYAWRLTLIDDTTGANHIFFTYDSTGRLLEITDTISRTAIFSYDPILPDCLGIRKVCKITYGGQGASSKEVFYRYDGDKLTGVKDPAGRWTTYGYTGPEDRLISDVTYPSGARSEYLYGIVKAGTELTRYVVITQKLRMRPLGGESYITVRKKTYDCSFVNDFMVYDRVTYYTGDSSVNGYTLYNMDIITNSYTETQVDASGGKLNQQRYWYESGRSTQQDAFMGPAASDGNDVTYSTYTNYDEYGNVIYARDSMGNETFSSYVNSDKQNAFYGPGRLSATTIGRIWWEDFRDRDVSDWLKEPNANAVVDESTFGILPPALKIDSEVSGDTNGVYHNFHTQYSRHVITALVLMGESSGASHSISIRSGDRDRIVITFGDDGFIYYSNGLVDARSDRTYLGGRWYKVSVVIEYSLSSYDLYIDTDRIAEGRQLRNVGGICDILFSLSGQPATMWINEVAVFKWTELKVGGADAETEAFLRVFDAVGGEMLAHVAFVSGSATATLNPYYFPRLTIQILDREWSVIYSSPSREFWGGSVYDFVEPTFISPFKKVTSGFMNSQTGWVDDSFPSTSTPETNHAYSWEWGFDNQVSGQKFHQSPSWPGQNWHGFKDAAPSQQPCPQPDDFNVQYVYLFEDAFPSEIKMQYQDGSGGENQWKHGVFWGSPLDDAREYNGTFAQEVWMGYIPPIFNRWIMLVAKQGDLDFLTSSCWAGVHYYLVGGSARWDYSAIAQRPGIIEVKSNPSGAIPYGAVVSMLDKKGNSWWGWADESGTAWIDAYYYNRYLCKGYICPNAFPFTAKFRIEYDGRILYESPYFDNIFGGDIFEYTPTENAFYPNSDISPMIKDRPSGLRVAQDDTTAQETRFSYGPGGLALETKVKGPSSWIVTSRKENDAFGNVKESYSLYDDSGYHETSYTYDPSYNDHLEMVEDNVPPQGWAVSSMDSDHFTGDTTEVIPPELRGTGKSYSYQYDKLGRKTRTTNPDGSYSTVEYWDTHTTPANLVVLKDELYHEPDAKRQTWQCYDSLGRLTEVARYGDAGPSAQARCISGFILDEMYSAYSTEFYFYNWQDQVERYVSPLNKQYYYYYDFLGRPTSMIRPDGISRTDVTYDDAANSKIVTTSRNGVIARKTQYIYAWNNRLIEVREFFNTGSNDYQTWSYAYDHAGNLVRATTPSDSRGISQATIQHYDELGRLTQTDYPDSTHEGFSYYNSGMLKTKVLRDQSQVTYTYDQLGRVKTVTYSSDGSQESYSYDGNGNVIGIHYGTVDVTYTRDYSNRDLPTRERYVVNGWVFDTYYGYDVAGNTVSMTYPNGGGTVYYRYDAFNRVCAAASSPLTTCSPTSNFYAKLEYYLDGGIFGIDYGNGIGNYYYYDLNGQPSLTLVPDSGGSLLKLEYPEYDATGNLKAAKTYWGGALQTTENYDYDMLGRLKSTSATGSWGWSRSYTYDSLGNRMSETNLLANPPSTTYYTYTTYSRLCRTGSSVDHTNCASAGDKYEYAPVGPSGEIKKRTVGGVVWDFAWSPRGDLKQIKKAGSTIATYTYDGAGRRVSSVVSGTTTYYIFSGISPIFETGSPQGSGTRYIYVGGLRIASISGSSTLYYSYDYLGNPRVITNSAGSLVARMVYRPFGACVYGCSPEPKYSYTGEYRESEPNLYYLSSRWYDPVIGRFISADDRLGSLSNPQKQNRYAYVGNNPVSFTDPTGHDWVSGADWTGSPSAPDWKYSVFCVVFILCAMTKGVDALYRWATGDPSWQEVVGFLVGIVAAIGSGLILGLLFAAVCAATAGIGCAVLAAVVGSVMGSIVSSLSYVAVTSALGGTPSAKGLEAASFAGGIAGGTGAALGFSMGMSAQARMAAAKGESAPEVATNVVIDRDWHGYQHGNGPGWNSKWSTPTRYGAPTEAQSALQLPDYNKALYVRSITIPRGTTVTIGPVLTKNYVPTGAVEWIVADRSIYITGPWEPFGT